MADLHLHRPAGTIRGSSIETRATRAAKQVIQMLSDIVSKNGNLLLNIPVRGDGTIDEKEEAILDQIGAWTARNGEAIYGTRPWRSYGEGPTQSPPAGGVRRRRSRSPTPPRTCASRRRATRSTPSSSTGRKRESAIASLGTQRASRRGDRARRPARRWRAGIPPRCGSAAADAASAEEWGLRARHYESGGEG